MAAPQIETYPDLSAMLLCTCCGDLFAVVVTVEDRRGGASLCSDCIAKLWELMEGHLGNDGNDGNDGGVVESSC